VRTYRLYVPAFYDEVNVVQLILVLHRVGGDARSAEKMPGFLRKSDEERFIVVYPEGMSTLRSWNSGNCCGDAMDEMMDDVTFIELLLKCLEEEMNTDRSRIFMTCVSNTSMMTYGVACKPSNRIATIELVAGAQNVPRIPTHLLLVVIFHGTDDQAIPFESGKLLNGRFGTLDQIILPPMHSGSGLGMMGVPPFIMRM
jgi:polyhydroxybutyrate depolymerase